MKKFKDWLVENFSNSVTSLEVPKLKLKVGASNLSELLMKHYRKEVGIQSRFGGIRNPPFVLANKIRHEFTNYDEIRDFLSNMIKNRELTNCDALKYRLDLVNDVKVMCDNLISQLPSVIDLRKESGPLVTKSELTRANNNYSEREIRNINSEMSHVCR
jgi:hypothetical protein